MAHDVPSQWGQKIGQDIIALGWTWGNNGSPRGLRTQALIRRDQFREAAEEGGNDKEEKGKADRKNDGLWYESCWYKAEDGLASLRAPGEDKEAPVRAYREEKVKKTWRRAKKIWLRI